MSANTGDYGHGYVTAYTAGGGTVRHIVARVGDYFNGYSRAAVCGTAPAVKWGVDIRWTTTDTPDRVFSTPAEAAAGSNNVCRRCAAAADKMAAAAEAEAEAAAEAIAEAVAPAPSAVASDTCSYGVYDLEVNGAPSEHARYVTRYGVAYGVAREMMSRGIDPAANTGLIAAVVAGDMKDIITTGDLTFSVVFKENS